MMMGFLPRAWRLCTNSLSALGQVTVVAPTESWSGASHTITFHEPLACTKVEIGGLFTGFGVQGSPADCVKLACLQLHEGPIDLVVSGINCGANVGINVYYSGTVAAAMEAAFLQIPSAAISVAAEDQIDFDKAAEYGVGVLGKLLPLHPGDVMNINIPLLSRGRPKGLRVVPQATSGFHEYYIPHKNGGSETRFSARRRYASGGEGPRRHDVFGGGLHHRNRPEGRHDRPREDRRVADARSRENPMSDEPVSQICIVTVAGQDRVGIVARLATTMAKANVNIVDINQKIMEDYFVMTMAVDIGRAAVDMGQIRKRLDLVGRQMALKITIQDENIFKAMHRVWKYRSCRSPPKKSSKPSR